MPPSEQRSQPARRAGEPASAHDRGTETVLLVEDDDAVRRLIGDVLRRRGYDVLPAADGVEALRLADSREAPIHLLITDVVMRGMTGVEVAGSIRLRRPAVKVLYVSGYTDDATVTLESQSHAFLGKPFTPDALVRKVRIVLSGGSGGSA